MSTVPISDCRCDRVTHGTNGCSPGEGVDGHHSSKAGFMLRREASASKGGHVRRVLSSKNGLPFVPADVTTAHAQPKLDRTVHWKSPGRGCNCNNLFAIRAASPSVTRQPAFLNHTRFCAQHRCARRNWSTRFRRQPSRCGRPGGSGRGQRRAPAKWEPRLIDHPSRFDSARDDLVHR